MSNVTAQRTPEEIAATVAKLQAEADKARAEAVDAQATAAGKLLENESLELSLEGLRAKHASWNNSDDRRHVYRFTSEVSPTSVKACMEKLTEWSRTDPGCDIEIVFSSPGGSIIDGMALFDHIQMVRKAGHRVTTGTIGYAASMAGILLQAGDHRWVGEQAWVLIHRASFGAVGSTFDVEDRVEWIKRIETRIIDIFVKRSGGRLTAQKIRKNWDRKDWWLTAEEALELGVADEVRGALEV